ncbi:multiple sugar transport system permease protein [Paenibacillus castaneae]|uniref:carbohydrate ABC transporter permease n=1 Tax=Paenibacillus castaneae TaxID=474957 RepID=UPI000C9AC64E|nr:sugar ABC transporter permease [Paenibacillus castaneae]NIK80310.1 multiple sugar transport system permease protein [Paenibacillus castaneae]
MVRTAALKLKNRVLGTKSGNSTGASIGTAAAVSAPVKPTYRKVSKLKQKEARTGWMYAMPALLLLILFQLWPMLFGLWISFWKWGFVPEKFIGLDNYARIFLREIFYIDPDRGFRIGEIGQSIIVTIYYAIGTIPVSIVLAFIIAYFLFQSIKGKAMLRTIFFLPFITSQVAAAIVFKWIFHPNVGIANSVMESVGLKKQNWLVDPDPIFSKWLALIGLKWPSWLPIELGGPTYALLIIMLFTVWGSVGFNIVIFLAGLSNISKELYEAAKIDGARTTALIRHVTLPLISPMLFLLTIVSVIGSFESFNAFYVFTNGEGGPRGSTMSLPLYIFRAFYTYGQVGYAAAVSMFLFVILLALTWVQYRFGEKRVHYQR